MEGGEWGFVEQTKRSNITAPQYMSVSFQEVRDQAHQAVLQKEELGTKARSDHESYWNDAAQGKVMEHQRYTNGWNLGFDDALTVYSMRSNGGLGQAIDSGADKLGCSDAWMHKRARDTGGQIGEYAWEWEQGLKAGIVALNQLVGI